MITPAEASVIQAAVWASHVSGLRLGLVYCWWLVARARWAASAALLCVGIVSRCSAWNPPRILKIPIAAEHRAVDPSACYSSGCRAEPAVAKRLASGVQAADRRC